MCIAILGVAFLLPVSATASVLFTVGPGTVLTQSNLGGPNPQYFYASTTANTSDPAGTLVYYNFCFHSANQNSNAPIDGTVSSAPTLSNWGDTISIPLVVINPDQQYCGYATTTLETNVVAGSPYVVGLDINGYHTGATLAIEADDFIQIADATTSIFVELTSPTSTAYFKENATGTLDFLANTCSTSGNILADALCSSFSFLFLPDPTVLNQWTQFPSVVEGKFPFSWVSGVQSDITGQEASSTANLPVMTFGLHDLGIGSTTSMGNILPNFTLFSTTTLTSLMPAGFWDTIQFLITVALWLELINFLFHDARRRFHRV